MKKKILLGLLVIVALFTITGCGKNSNNNSNVKSSKEYNINGISFELDKEDSISKMKYKVSNSFDRRAGASTTVYYLYYDENKDKYDASNLVFSILYPIVTSSISDNKLLLRHFENAVLNIKYAIKLLGEFFSIQSKIRFSKHLRNT